MEGTFMRPRDLDCIALLPRIVETGVAAVKIEGRFKSPRYVKVTTRAARYVLDAIRDGKDPELPERLRRPINSTFFFGSGTGYMLSRHPEPDALCTDGGRAFNRIRDFLRTPRSYTVIPRLLWRKVTGKAKGVDDPIYTPERLNPAVAESLGATRESGPAIVVDVSATAPVIPAGADLVYVGEKHCATRFLHSGRRLPELLEQVRETGAETGVIIPARVRESLVGPILKRMDRLGDLVDRVLCYDLGLAAELSRRLPVTVSALVQPPETADHLAATTGAAAVRPLHFPLPLYLEHGFPSTPVEVPVFGHWLIDGMLLCLSRVWTACPNPEPQLWKVSYEHKYDMFITGTSLYSGRIYSAHLILDHLRRLPVSGLVLDSFNQDRETLERVIAFMRGRGVPAGRRQPVQRHARRG